MIKGHPFTMLSDMYGYAGFHDWSMYHDRARKRHLTGTCIAWGYSLHAFDDRTFNASTELLPGVLEQGVFEDNCQFQFTEPPTCHTGRIKG